MQVAKKYPKFSWLRILGPMSVCIIAILAVVIGNLDSEGNELIRTLKGFPQGKLLHFCASVNVPPTLLSIAFQSIG
jgi:hypothetical protein